MELALAHRLADLAAEIALRRLGAPEAESKADGSPVTAADREIELALRDVLARERPGDAFLGEEFGARGRGERRWIVDAIDGTASYLAGRPEWSTLIALEAGGTVSLGLVSAPALGRRWWAARGGGAWCTPRAPLRASSTPAWREATLAIWPPPHRLTKANASLAADYASRCGRTIPPLDWSAADPDARSVDKPSTGSGTCHGALLVATGQVDAFLLLGAGEWDIAALAPIVEEAGGAMHAPGAQAVLFTNGCLPGPRR